MFCFNSYRFKRFNDRYVRRILIRDNRAESSIVALYKKMELLNAMELLDTQMGDISAAPSIVSLQYVINIKYKYKQDINSIMYINTERSTSAHFSAL